MKWFDTIAATPQSEGTRIGSAADDSAMEDSEKVDSWFF
jgi:hypothetical protein